MWLNRRRDLQALILAILFSLLAGGCFPAIYYDVPAIHGRIVNSHRTPVASARVRLLQIEGYEHRDITILTDRDGVFSRAADKRFYIASPLPFEMGWSKCFDVTATDGAHSIYLGDACSTYIVIGLDTAGATNVDFGTVVLH